MSPLRSHQVVAYRSPLTTLRSVTEILRVSQVFVPGKLPAYTYNPREDLNLEEQLNDYVEEAGSILTVSGPTKTGKSVLLRRVVTNPVWVDGQGVSDVDELWRRVADGLQVYTQLESTQSQLTTGTAKGGVEVNVGVVKGTTGADYAATDGSGTRYMVDRPVAAVAPRALEASRRPLVLDDFHFIQRGVQRDIVRALKPLVLAGVPVIFVSISHRVQDVVTAEPDMTGRVSSLAVDLWGGEELVVIAQKGFKALNLRDPDDRVARVLADSSYGSPHLMQKFCREICKDAGIRQAQAITQVVPAASDWNDFFSRQVDGASADWFQRLLRGPQERGSIRTQWRLQDGRTLDGYGLTLAAIARTGPKLTLSKDDIKHAVEGLVENQAPAAHQTTRVLQHMTKIAAKRANEPVPTEAELDQQDLEPDAVPDVQPVLEYIEDGPSSSLHIADPFFAFYLRWGTWRHLDDLPARPR